MWILEKCPETSVRTYHNMDFSFVLGNHRGCHYTASSLQGGRERPNNLKFADSELWGAENLTLSMRGKSDAQKGAACSKVTLYREGSNASSTDKESS